MREREGERQLKRLAGTPCEAGKANYTAIFSYILIFPLQDLFENIQDAFETDLDMDLDSFTQGETEFAGQVMTFSLFSIVTGSLLVALVIGKKSLWYFTSSFLCWHLFLWLSRCQQKMYICISLVFKDNKLVIIRNTVEIKNVS
jgi:hypothetical protein